MDYLKNKEKGVEVITKLIESGKPFSVTRIGLGEVRCFQLGHQYPDLCSSIFLVCKKIV
jgi:hypothetical protein